MTKILFTPFGRVHIADSTGFGLLDSLRAQFPGAGGSGSKAGAKIQLVWDYKSHTFDRFCCRNSHGDELPVFLRCETQET